MIRVSGVAQGGAASPARKAAAGGGFRVDAGKGAASAAPAGTSAPVETLSALIALQSDSREAGARAKTLAAAQRTLDLLDRLRLGILEGAAGEDDLAALADAAIARADDAALEPGLAALYEDIALRARVELAKRGL